MRQNLCASSDQSAQCGKSSDADFGRSGRNHGIEDRIAVLFGGKIVGVLSREEATIQKIGLLMGGISEEEENNAE